MKKLLLNSISVATTLLVLFSCKEESLNLSPFRRICNQTAPEKGICNPQQKGRANGEGLQIPLFKAAGLQIRPNGELIKQLLTY